MRPLDLSTARRPVGHRCRRALATLAVLILPVTGLAMPASAQPPEPDPATPAVPAPDQATSTHQVTLITGDQVSLTIGGPEGPYQVDVEPAARADGVPASTITQTGPDAVYVLPSDALPAIQSGRLDKELFNVRYLAEHGYGDAESDQLPVIVSYPEPTGAAARGYAPDGAELAARAADLPAATGVVGLTSIHGAGVSVPKRDAAEFWHGLQETGTPKVWLDQVAELVLEDSVPLVGAPDAWAAGFDGTGVNVAVLDTGVDLNHPDLAGQVAAAESFVAGAPPQDGHGHGTHVASTIAGTGAASDGLYTGVAPGASLLSGRICDDSGGCPTSSIIAGMEWAAGEMAADVVSMSVSGGVSDGTDPLSQAVNDLTASTGALFVVAAGNNGGDTTVGSPGAADAALTVAATDKSDALAGFSSRGPRFGDLALKPDIAAPGVSIAAARAAGTSMGTPVNDDYTTASGTSMATPHVSGATAVVLQQHPDWTATELKAALMSTTADARHTVYQQGAGRLDVARATRQEVFATTANLDFGLVELPGEGEPEPAPIVRQVDYTNLDDQPVTLELTPSLASTGGAPVPAGALSADATVTVPAGGTATATVTLDPAGLGEAWYTGSLVATDATGLRLTTPVGLVREPERHTLTVRTLGRDGQPLSPRYSDVVDVADSRGRQDGTFTGEGVVSYRVPLGVYSIAQRVTWVSDENSRMNFALLFAPEVAVTGDTEVVLDTRTAEQITFSTPEQAVPANSMPLFLYQRTDADGHSYSNGDESSYGPSAHYWATPTEPVTVGAFRFHHQWALVEPELEMAIRGRGGVDLQPILKLHGPGWRTPEGFDQRGFWVPFTGTRDFPVVDAGQGRPEDLAGLDLAGKLALVEVAEPPNNDQGWCWISITTAEAVRDAGAAGMLLFNSQPGCAAPLQIAQEHLKPLRPAKIAHASLSKKEALALRERLARGPVTIRSTANPDPSYAYHLGPYEEGRIPDSLHYTVSEDDLARFDQIIHEPEPEPSCAPCVMDSWNIYKPDDQQISFSNTNHGLSPAPHHRRDYVGPLSAGDVLYNYKMWADYGLPEPVTTFREIQGVLDQPIRASRHWFAGPATPGAYTPPDNLYSAPNTGRFPDFSCAGCRRGDVFFPMFTGRTQSRGLPAHGMDYTVGSEVELLRDGVEIPVELLGGLFPMATLPEEPGMYQLSMGWQRGLSFPRTTSTWTFTSSRPTEDALPPHTTCLKLSTDPCRPEPLVYVTYDLGDTLATDNSVRAGRHTFDVSAYHQNSTAPMPEIAGLRLWVSYDDGEEWKPAAVSPRGDGQFRATLWHRPARHRASDEVSLRVEAWDVDGNRLEQTTWEAFTIRTRH